MDARGHVNINILKLHLGAVGDSMTNVWARPGGIAAGRAGQPIGSRLRDAFLGTVAAGALSLAFGGPALAGPDACTLSGGGTVENCSGNQSAGIIITSPTAITTLNVNTLNQAIAPASGVDGIHFTSTGAVTVNSNTGAFGISTTGNTANGIAAVTLGVNAAVTVTSTGNITSAGSGIVGYSRLGALTLTSTGNIAAGAYAINAYGGVVTVTSTGNVNTSSNDAIRARVYGNGTLTVTSTGNVTTTGASASAISPMLMALVQTR